MMHNKMMRSHSGKETSFYIYVFAMMMVGLLDMLNELECRGCFLKLMYKD